MTSRWLALAVLTLARAAMGFQFQSAASVSPLLVRDLGIGYADAGFLIGVFMLPGVVLALPGGLLGQRFGDKRVVIAGLFLMALGSVLSGLAETYAVLVVGRILSGTGAVLLNVAMSKMVVDWFAGREIVLAMAIFVNSFPIGIGLALLVLGHLGEAAGWAACFHVGAIVALASLALVAFLYRAHPNDCAGPAQGGPISGQEIMLVCLAGAIWGIYNGAFAIMSGFTPIVLSAAGLSLGNAGFLVGLSTWLIVLSVQAGGVVAERWGHADALLVAGVIVWAACLLLLPTTDPVPLLVLTGLFQGLPVGIIVSLPARVLRPSSRGTGMGLFYTGLYLGHAVLPPAAGALQDWGKDPALPLYLAGAMVLLVLPIYAAFRLGETYRVKPA